MIPFDLERDLIDDCSRGSAVQDAMTLRKRSIAVADISSTWVIVRILINELEA
jgi:hypothetical protein